LNWTKSDKKITSPNIFRLTSDFELYFVWNLFFYAMFFFFFFHVLFVY
jgi:hypothetical protein